MEHGVQPLPADRLVPQPRRESPAKRERKKREREFDLAPPEQEQAHSGATSAPTSVPPPEDGTGSRLDITA